MLYSIVVAFLAVVAIAVVLFLRKRAKPQSLYYKDYGMGPYSTGRPRKENGH